MTGSLGISTATMRILRPAPNVLAFYDGRVAGQRLFSPGPNWIDDGAYELGIASYAIVAGEAAIVYDTHVSLEHAQVIRQTLQAGGVRDITIVLSHWHLDHIGGTAIFADCPIIAHEQTLSALVRHRDAIEAGRSSGMPAIQPLVLPNQTYAERLVLQLGPMAVELRHRDIHSCDGTVLLLPEQRLLLAGDTLEDTVTYVAEPEGLDRHLRDLEDMAGWDIGRILPNHGDPDRIAQGGYAPSLISANQRYLERLLRTPKEAALRQEPLAEFVAEELAEGSISYFQPYAVVHQANLAEVMLGNA